MVLRFGNSVRGRRRELRQIVFQRINPIDQVRFLFLQRRRIRARGFRGFKDLLLRLYGLLQLLGRLLHARRRIGRNRQHPRDRTKTIAGRLLIACGAKQITRRQIGRR